MEVMTYEYNGKPVTYMKLSGNDLLLKTTDVCGILGITDRPAGTELSQPSLNLVSAIRIADSHNTDFSMWLMESFGRYNVETLVHPNVDDDWNEVP